MGPLLRGRQATTHWTALDVLQILGATARTEREVTDGTFVFGAGGSPTGGRD
ncbi:hypothetical protein GR927_41670 [Mycolicibacterium sp. 3033]|nr:hypothetical protein [Mycolicibacterium aurantiacum]